MRLHILRLTSVVSEGVGGTEAGALDLIYSFLMQEYNCDYYGHIFINQIGDDLEEVFFRNGKNITMNIRYPTINFSDKNSREKNLIRLDIVHTALLRIAKKENRIDVNALENIKNRVLKHDFLFDFEYKQYEDKKKQLIGKIIIHPLQDKFCYYFTTKQDNGIERRILLYEGKCTEYYIREIFYKGKWKGPNEFVVTDKRKEIEMQIFITENSVKLVNLTRYEKPPFFEGMKAGKTNENTYKDWLHSLPPGIAGIITYEPN